jgi:hypothetical protein
MIERVRPGRTLASRVKRLEIMETSCPKDVVAHSPRVTAASGVGHVPSSGVRRVIRFD